MAVGRLVFDQFAKRFPMMDGPRPAIIRSVGRDALTATRVSYDLAGADRTDPTPIDDAFALVLRLKYQRADIWLDGRHSAKSPVEGETSMYDLQTEIMVHFRDPFDFLYFHIPRRALVEFAQLEDAAGVNLGLASGKNFADPVIAHLGAALLPALDDPRQANELFVGHVAMALQTHFLATYIGTSRPLRRYRSGLTARQLRIAKQTISENLDGGMSLNAVARECGLSPSHFARAFAVSVGQPPHQWLLDQRVDLARQLLSESPLPLADIAVQCGFADQSHFTRVFSGRTGLSPGRWRRVRKL
jgi:AraC family transcriptional regulator